MRIRPADNQKPRQDTRPRQHALIAAACAVFVASLMSGCASSGSSKDSGAPITLRLGGDQAASSPTAKAEEYFAKTVKDLTSGKVQITVYSNNQLGDEAQALAQVEAGSLDFADPATTNISGQVKPLGVFDLPFLATTTEQSVKLSTDGSVTKALNDALSPLGVQDLGVMASGPIVIQAKKPIASPADFKDFKIRSVTNPITVALLKSMGAVVTPLPPLQVYSALQQGVTDGSTTSYQADLTQKWYEPAKYMSLLPTQYLYQMIMASSKTMDKLSKDQQDAIKKAAVMTVKYNNNQQPAALESILKQLKAAGAIVSTPSPDEFIPYGQKIQDQFTSSIGSSVVDAAKSAVGKK